VLAQYTYEHAATLLAKTIRMVKAGEYGVMYPYPFAVGCAARNRNIFTNEWCG
jgi:hypothetical protein